jgi:hypothetical protein
MRSALAESRGLHECWFWRNRTFQFPRRSAEMSQTRLLGPTDSDVRFQAIGKQAVMTEIGAQSCHRFNPMLGTTLRYLRSSCELKQAIQ